MDAGGDDQQRFSLRGRKQCGVDGKLLAGWPDRIRMQMTLDAEPPGLRSGEELAAGFIVGLREESFDRHGGNPGAVVAAACHA